MQLPYPKDAQHKAWLYRILSAFYDDAFLARILYFKGGTCAAMLGILDRFSVDLDFDLVGSKDDFSLARARIEKIFSELGLEVKDQSQRISQYFLKYPTKASERNSLKIDMSFPPSRANKYEAKRFTEIDRIITCQSVDTMFANKLVALISRFKQKSAIAGRDVYDVHHFFEQGLKYNSEVIVDLTGQTVEEFFRELIIFVEQEITDDLIVQDLNALLPYAKFRAIRKTLKQETLMFLRDEYERIKHV